MFIGSATLLVLHLFSRHKNSLIYHVDLYFISNLNSQVLNTALSFKSFKVLRAAYNSSASGNT